MWWVFKNWLKQYFRISVFSYNSLVILEFWKLNISIECHFLQKGHIKVLCTPFVSLIRRRYKVPQYDLFLELTLISIVITYCNHYNPNHEAKD